MSVTGTVRGGSRRWLLPLVAVVLTGLLGGVLLWTLHGRQGSGPAVPVAIVNADDPVTTGSGKDQKTVAAGRQLAGGLTQPSADDQTPLSWQLVDADDAAGGLRDGSYYAVLTIPAGFSAAVTSTGGDEPEAAQLQLVSNDASSAAVAALAQLSVTQAAATLGDQVTNGFVDQTLTSLTTIHTNLASTATSSHQLADSSHQVAGSSDDLADGSASLATGAVALASGADQAASGADALADGAGELDSAAGKLARGARTTARGAESLSTAARAVARGDAALADRTRAQARRLDRLGTASGRVSTGSGRVADRAADVARTCPPSAGRDYCAEVRRLAVASRVEAGAVRAVDAGVGVAGRRADRIADGAAKVERGAKGVARGGADLASATSSVGKGAGQLASAAGTLASGAAQVASGNDQLSQGADQNAAGAKKLASGAGQLASGSDQLADGADSLAKGLDSFTSSVPSYSSAERKQLDTVVTNPVAVAASAEHQATVSTAITPVVLALALWLGTLMMFLTRDAVPTGSLWAQARAGRRVLLGWLPAVGVGLAQVAVLLVLVGVVGMPVRSPAGLVGFAVLGTLAFAATNQVLVSLFGALGRLVSLAFTMVEAAALGGLVPIETAPGLIQLLNEVLPVPRFVEGAGRLVLGGSSGDLVGACVVLAAWTVVPLLVTTLVTGRERPALSSSPTLVPPLAPAPVPVG